MSRDFYTILQIDPGVDQETVEIAYRRLALRYHPDHNSSPDATRLMQEVNEAYTTLRNPGQRARYDREYLLRRPPVRTSRPATTTTTVVRPQPWSPPPTTRPTPPPQPAPEPAVQPPADEQQRLVLFYLDGQPYGFNLEDVETVVWMQPITTSSECPSFIEGVAEVRKSKIPIIDLRKHLGFPQKEINRDTRIILGSIAGTRVGLIVDSIENYLCVPLDDIQSLPGMGFKQAAFIQGYARVGMRMVVMLNLPALLTEEEKAGLFAYASAI